MDNLNGKFNGPFLPDSHSGIEWLETNNAGAYASSSIIEQHRRKYHGLLVTPIGGHEGRYHILSGVDLSIDSPDRLTTGTTEYPGAYFPEGWKQLESVSLLPIQQWNYRSGNTSLKKEIFMRRNETAVWIAYTLDDGDEQVDADLKFLFTFRNSHDLTSKNYNINIEPELTGEKIIIRPYEGLPAAEIIFSGEWNFTEGLYWDDNICYASERERGLEWVEDRFVPGKIRISLHRGKPFVIRVGLADGSHVGGGELIGCYENEKSGRFEKYPSPKDPLDLLIRRSTHFFLQNPSGKRSINAGYPWFGEWSRDTMLSLPGLTFYSGRIQTGIDILGDYISMIKDGLLPNTLGDTQGFTSYNSIDAGLLFCWAVNKLIDFGYGKKASEQTWLSETIFPAVQGIVDAFIENRVPEAELDQSGLLKSGTPETQLTWMDAKAWGRAVTPRYGYAVELNALWYDALVLLDMLGMLSGKKIDGSIKNRIETFPSAFREKFWLADEGYLSDTVNENGPDGKIRPNMLFASSAREGLLEMEQRRSVVETAERHLLTDYGLRTLSPSDPDFYGVYTGNPDERDSRYHQGTVWPWLLGIMIESSLKSTKDIATKRIFWSDYIENFLSSHLFRDGWGSVSEIFDGLVPGAGKGCFAQAWSCGEIIRAAELVRKDIN